MANKKHLARLKKGIHAWNVWRLHNPEFRPSLIKADLHGERLSEIDLSRSNLREANLSRSKLNDSYFGNASLIKANLHEADFALADLASADFHQANLYRADLVGADLRWTNISDANLTDADLERADLRWANLRNADLTNANLIRADLRGADLSYTTFCFAHLTGTNLADVDLRGADLRGANLIDANLKDANLTDARLWETQRTGWSISGIQCERACWDRNERNLVEFKPGEFERAFAEKPQLRISYPEGLSPLDMAMLPLMIERLQAKHEGRSLHVRSIYDEGHGAVLVITVDELVSQKELEQLRLEMKYMQGQRDLLMPLYQEWLKMGKNQINIGQIAGPSVIDGTQHVSSVSYRMSDLAEIRRLIDTLLEDQSQWTAKIADEERDPFKSVLEQIKLELAKGEPDQSLVSAGLRSLKSMLESAAGTAIYGGTLAALLALAK